MNNPVGEAFKSLVNELTKEVGNIRSQMRKEVDADEPNLEVISELVNGLKDLNVFVEKVDVLQKEWNGEN